MWRIAVGRTDQDQSGFQSNARIAPVKDGTMTTIGRKSANRCCPEIFCSILPRLIIIMGLGMVCVGIVLSSNLGKSLFPGSTLYRVGVGDQWMHQDYARFFQFLGFVLAFLGALWLALIGNRSSRGEHTTVVSKSGEEMGQEPFPADKTQE